MTDKACAEGFPITALRETNVLLALRHENIVRVKEMVVGSSQDKVYMVMECLDHELKALLDTMEQPFDQAEIKCLMQQILSSVAFMHANWCVLWSWSLPRVLPCRLRHCSCACVLAPPPRC